MTSRSIYTKSKWLQRGIITGLFLIIVGAASAWHFSQPITGLETLVTERLSTSIRNAGGQFAEIHTNAAALEISIDGFSIAQPDGAGRWSIEKLTISGIHPKAFQALTAELPQHAQATSVGISAQTFCNQILAEGIKFIAEDGSTSSVASLKLDTVSMTPRAQEAQFNQLLQTHPEALFVAFDVDSIQAEKLIWMDTNNVITTQADRLVIAPYQAGLVGDLHITSFTHQPTQSANIALLFDTITLKNIDMRDTLESLMRSQPGSPNKADIYSQAFAQARVEAIKATQFQVAQDGRSIQMAELEVSDIKHTDDALTHAHTRIKNAQIAVADLEPDAQKQFADLGYDKLRFSMESLFSLDPKKRTLNLSDTHISAEDMGTLSLSLALSGIKSIDQLTNASTAADKQIISPDVIALAQAMRVVALDFHYSDSSLVERYMAQQMEETGLERKKLAQQFAHRLRERLLIQTENAFTNEAEAALATFLTRPQNIGLKLTPEKPMSMIELAFFMALDAGLAVNALAPEISVNQ